MTQGWNAANLQLDTRPFRSDIPSRLDKLPNFDQTLCDIAATMFADCRNRCGWTYPPRPIGAADKGFLTRLHHSPPSDHSGHGIPITHPLPNPREVRFNAVE